MYNEKQYLLEICDKLKHYPELTDYLIQNHRFDSIIDVRNKIKETDENITDIIICLLEKKYLKIRHLIVCPHINLDDIKHFEKNRKDDEKSHFHDSTILTAILCEKCNNKKDDVEFEIWSEFVKTRKNIEKSLTMTFD